MRPFYYTLAAIIAVWLLFKLYRRLQLSAAKHRSLAGHSRWAKRFAALVPFYEYSEAQLFAADDATQSLIKLRREGFARLASTYATRFKKSAALSSETAEGVSDMQFTSRYRVPYQFSRYVRERLRGGS